MVVVSTKQELKSAIKANEPSIKIVGEMAEKFKRRRKLKKIAGAGLTAGAAMIAMAPLTGGFSAIPGAMCLTISTTELALILGTVIATLAMHYGYKKIIYNTDGSVSLEKE